MKVMASVRVMSILIATIAAGVLLSTPLRAQTEADVPSIDQVEQVFAQALAAFEEGDYGMAYRRFRLIYSSYPLNTRTTASILMAGKALYREGRHDDAVALLEEFVRDYESSSYVGEARATIEAVHRQRRVADATPETIQLGILLPLTNDDASLAQAMFNGIRLAVDEHNERSGVTHPVRMVFRNTEGTEGGARAATGELIELGASSIIGPLYSEEAVAAGDVADRNRKVLIAPLATEEVVSDGKRYVFQANPTWTVRGQMLGRFAVERFGHRRFAVMAEFGDSFSERMAEGFQEEVDRLGGQVLHYRLLEQASSWYSLDRILPATTWDSLDAIYLPISGRDAEQLASGALSALARGGLTPQVFGSSDWAEVSALSIASDYNTVYATNFYLLADDPAVARFEDAYRRLAGVAPQGELGRVAFAGYDVTRFLLQRLTQQGDEELVSAISDAPWYQGLGSRLYFEGGNVNKGLFYMRYRPGKVDLLR